MKTLIPIVLLFFVSAAVIAQSHTLPKYRRSSIYTLMIDDTTRLRAEVIKGAFIKYPVPDKFDDHNLKERLIQAKASTVDQVVTITNYLNSNNVARKLVAKWFDRSDKGAFDMDLISKRGLYNASEMDVNLAKMSKRGKALLQDAGEELIKNTFVLVSDFKYTTDSAIRADAQDIQKKTDDIPLSGPFRTFRGLAKTATSASKLFNGYVVKTTSYLFRLDWTDSAAAVLYNDYWMDNGSLSPVRKAAFDSSQAFKLIYIGKDDGIAGVQDLKLARKSEDSLIAAATVNAVDAVIAKLQKNHQEFRTKTPLYTNDPASAKIGMKEGLEAGDSYEVLEQVESPEGKTSYEKVGTIYVDKSQIWDNRYMADADTTKIVDRTLFKGGSSKKMFPGQLIRQR